MTFSKDLAQLILTSNATETILIHLTVIQIPCTGPWLADQALMTAIPMIGPITSITK